MPSGTVISQYLGSHFKEKERNRWRKFFFSSENAFLSILLKYQKIDVQSKRLTEKTLLQKRMTKIDIAYRIKVSKTAVFPNLFFFLIKLLRNQTTRTLTDSEKH